MMKILRNLILFSIFCFGVFAPALAQTESDGLTCNTAFPVDTAYHCTLSAGEYWFTAETPALPLTIYYYPEDPAAQPPLVYLDLTCTPGVYDDPNVARMVSMAGEYNLSFPMQYVMEKQVDDDERVFYTILFDRNYRDMLYNQGVTYAISAFVRITHFTNATIDIRSTSINSRCRDYVYTLGMNTALRYAPDDSLNVYVWPLGEWIDSIYRFTWTGEQPLEIFTGKDCQVARGKRVWDEYILPKDSIYMSPLKSQEWIKDIYSTDLYVRLYAKQEGTLRIATYDRTSKITAVTFEYNGEFFPATIDQEKMTISAVLPAGANQKTVIANLDANKETAIQYEAYNNEVIEITNKRQAYLSFGNLVYQIILTISKAEGNTDATLHSLYIDGKLFEDFDPATLNYLDVEATQADRLPVVTDAHPANDKATVVIENITALPGTATITVTAEAGNTQVYTIEFIQGRSHDATLSAITIDGKPLQGFTPEEQSYRVVVKYLPVVDAVAADPLSTVTIYQAKTIPGWAQVQVKAEAGNVETYTINFSPDKSLEQCLQTYDTIAFSEPVALGVNEPLYRIPVRSWKSLYVELDLEAEQVVPIYVLPTCKWEVEELSELILDTLYLAPAKNDPKYRFKHYWRPDDLNRLSRLSANGNIYLYIPDAREGSNLLVRRFTEDCITRSELLELPSVNTMQANRHDIVYKLYVNDYTDADTVRFIWQGTQELTLYLSRHCEFMLEQNNRYLLKPSPFTLSAGTDTLDILKSLWEDWAYEVDDFFYARMTNRATGTLTIQALNDPNKPTDALPSITDSALSVALLPGAVLSLTAGEPQTVSVYTPTGICIRTWQMLYGETQTLQLPAGVYLIKGHNSVQKILINN